MPSSGGPVLGSPLRFLCRILGCAADLLPQFIPARPTLGGVGQHLCLLESFAESLERIPQLVARETVGFRGDNQKTPPGRREKLEQTAVILLGWNIAIHQRQAERQGRPVLQIRLNELWPLLRDLPRDLGIAVSRKVGENKLG